MVMAGTRKRNIQGAIMKSGSSVAYPFSRIFRLLLKCVVISGKTLIIVVFHH